MRGGSLTPPPKKFIFRGGAARKDARYCFQKKSQRVHFPHLHTLVWKNRRAFQGSSASHAMYRTVLLALLAGSITSLRVPNVIARRRAIALAVGAVAASQSNALPALAADSKPVKVYFGAGCFWHVQHEFTMEEMSTLKRSSSQISAVSGYAGGQRLGDGGKVCCELKAARIHGRFARPSRRPHSAACRVSTLTV